MSFLNYNLLIIWIFYFLRLYIG